MFFTRVGGIDPYSEGSSRFEAASRCGTAVAVGVDAGDRAVEVLEDDRRTWIDGYGLGTGSTMVSISSSDRPAVKLDSQ